MNFIKLAVTIAMLTGLLQAEGIEGSVVITKKLTKRRVTAPVNSYEHGVMVDLPASQPEDFVAFERSRVVVYLEGDFPTEPVNAVLEQKNRQFGTDTLVIPVGSTVSFPNRDPIFHNVFSLSKPKSFDLGNYTKDHTRSVTFSKPGIVFVNCHLHPNMAAAIAVGPNRWITKVDGTGHFALPDVPPGRYTVVAWHRAAGFFRKPVRVSGSHAGSVEFIIPLEGSSDSKIMARR